jgi:hypothetical protein
MKLSRLAFLLTCTFFFFTFICMSLEPSADVYTSHEQLKMFSLFRSIALINFASIVLTLVCGFYFSKKSTKKVA